MTGMFAVSKAGHDKGRMYIIMKEEGEYVYLADGKTRTIENPKKKKKKHIINVYVSSKQAFPFYLSPLLIINRY